MALAPLFFVAACSTGESAQNTPTPEAGSTLTQQSSQTNDPAPPDPQTSSKAKTSTDSPGDGADAAPAAENTAAGFQEDDAAAGASNRAVDHVASDYLDLVKRNPAPGQTATVAGTYYEVCLLGDGFGLHTVLAGENTSCGFGRAVVDTQTAGHHPTGENIRDFYQPEISVTSPTTGQTYALQCSVSAGNSIECTGGNNARVVLY